MPLLAIIPALVEVAKRNGLAARYAGGAAIVLAFMLLMLGDLALGDAPDPEGWSATIARWLIEGIVYGLAAAGLYSQREVILPRDTPPR